MDIARFEELKEHLQEVQSKQDRAKGAKQQLIKTLKEKFSCADKDEATELKEKLEEEINEKEKEYEKELKAFEREFADDSE